MIVFSALMIWKGLMFWTKAESPVVVVLRYLSACACHCPFPFSLVGPVSPSLPAQLSLLFELSIHHLARLRQMPKLQSIVSPLLSGSGSMEPAFFRGDILFLNRGDAPFAAGEVCVFKISGREIPIVHRCRCLASATLAAHEIGSYAESSRCTNGLIWAMVHLLDKIC